MKTAKSQYGYFTSLEKTITLAVAFYGTILLSANIALTGMFQRFLEDLHVNQYVIFIFFAVGAVGIFFAVLFVVRKIGWISKANAWLDGKFFGLLEKSNAIIFQALLVGLDDESQHTASTLPQNTRDILAQNIFNQLAGEDALFLSLLNSGIFRLWIWYWITIYGMCVFMLMTLELFSATAFGMILHAKMFFTVSWLLAILHLACGIFLGYHLSRMTHNAAASIVESHGSEISSLLKEHIEELQE